MFTSIDTCSARKSLIHFVWRALFFPPFASAIRIQSGLMLLIQNEMHLKFQLLSALAKYKFECAEKNVVEWIKMRMRAYLFAIRFIQN